MVWTKKTQKSIKENQLHRVILVTQRICIARCMFNYFCTIIVNKDATVTSQKWWVCKVIIHVEPDCRAEYTKLKKKKRTTTNVWNLLPRKYKNGTQQWTNFNKTNWYTSDAYNKIKSYKLQSKQHRYNASSGTCKRINLYTYVSLVIVRLTR